MPDTGESGKNNGLSLSDHTFIVSIGVILQQCVSALSHRFLSESIWGPLCGNAATHREGWQLGVPTHTWTNLDPLHPHQEDPQQKIHPSILRKRSNLISSSPDLSHSQKSDRRVRFRDPEYTVHTYCAPGRPHLTLQTCLVLLLSVLVVLLLCTSCHQSERLCEVFQAVMGKVVWSSWLWLTMQ